jgi:hypothetical protein
MTRRHSKHLEPFILYFLERAGPLGRTQIVKLLYLADLEARRWLGRPLTDLKWIRFHYGPWEQAIAATLDGLGADQGVSRQVVHFPSGDGELFSIEQRARAHAFAPAEEAILAFVAESHGVLPRRQLVDDVVYQTRPMKEGSDRLRAPLPMHLVDNEAILEMGGLSLERALAAEAELARGEVVAHEDLKRRILG